MYSEKYLSFSSNRQKIVISTEKILYVIMANRNAEIHVAGGEVYKTRMAFSTIEETLGERFLKVHRGCLVSVTAIHDITDYINLSNGERLEYAKKNRNNIVQLMRAKQRGIIGAFHSVDVPATYEEYLEYYFSFEKMPFAFTDIEMVFDENRQAVDWIFRYGNPALANLEKLPLEKLIGSSFGSLFANMDSKWLRSYERAALYGETLEIIDYSPEIDTYLKVLCFPTFKGHCGCLLLDISQVKFTRNSGDAERALMLYFGAKPDAGR